MYQQEEPFFPVINLTKQEQKTNNTNLTSPRGNISSFHE